MCGGSRRHRGLSRTLTLATCLARASVVGELKLRNRLQCRTIGSTVPHIADREALGQHWQRVLSAEVEVEKFVGVRQGNHKSVPAGVQRIPARPDQTWNRFLGRPELLWVS